MNKKKSLRQRLFGDDMEVQQILINLILTVAIVLGTISLVLSLLFLNQGIYGNSIVIGVILAAMFALWLSVAKKKVKLAALVITSSANIILFPLMYFLNGGMNSGMPLWLLLGLIFSWLILQGRSCYIMYVINAIVMAGSVFVEQHYPHLVTPITNRDNIAFDIAQSLVIVSCVIGIIFKFQTSVYVRQQKKISQQDEELRSTMENLRHASHAKSDFLSSMSHEIRTPINAVLGMNEMILRENKQKNIAEYARNINSAGQTLLALINDVLDFSKIESGKMEIVPDKYNLFEVLKDSYNMISMRARDKNLKLEVENDAKIPYRLYGDEIRVRQIIFNLLTNAVKYTKEGKVTLSVDWVRKNKETMILKVSVRDTGIGITEENRKVLFESFERIEEKKNRHIEGTGLGLSITKQLLDLMGGNIMVESEYGVGSTFTVEIPQKVLSEVPMGNFYERYEASVAKVEKEKKKDRLEAPDARLLVIDDMPMNLDVVTALLKRTKIHVERASSGEEGLDKIKKKKYDVILLDHMMPEMDGIETLQRVRALKDNINEGTPVIAMTANAVIGAKEEYLNAGFQDYLSKPVKGEDLEAMIWKYMPKHLIQRTSEGEGEVEVQTAVSDEELLEALYFLDTESGMMYSGGTVELYRDILVSYIGKSNLSEQLQETFEKKNWADYSTHIHALKSASLSIGATELSADAKELEMAAKEGNVEFVEKYHDDVMKDYTELLKKLRLILGEKTGAGDQQTENKLSEYRDVKHILIIDEDYIGMEPMKEVLSHQFRVTCATDFSAAMEEAKMDTPNLILIDMDLPEMDGFEAIHRIRNIYAMRDKPIIFMSMDYTKDIEVQAFKEGAIDFIRKPAEPDILLRRISRIFDLRHLQHNLEEEVERQTHMVKEREEEVERLSIQTMMTLAATIDAKDKYTNDHSKRVAEYGAMIARRAGMSEKEADKVYYMGLLHDIGVISIPDHIINRKDLSDEEEKIMQKHTQVGADILKQIEAMPELQIGAKYHHEWYDGSGYPEGLKGEEIPKMARIVSIADAYDAMTSDRIYRDVLSQDEVKREIIQGKGTQFDPDFAGYYRRRYRV